MSVPSSHESRARPTRSDPVVAASAPIIGGPLGERVARVAPPWSVLRVLILLATLGYVEMFIDRLAATLGELGWAP